MKYGKFSHIIPVKAVSIRILTTEGQQAGKLFFFFLLVGLPVLYIYMQMYKSIRLRNVCRSSNCDLRNKMTVSSQFRVDLNWELKQYISTYK